MDEEIAKAVILPSDANTVPLMHRRLALHKVVAEVDDHIITTTGEVLNTDAYSRFKYGHHIQAGKYADELTELLLQGSVADQFDGDKPLVVTASAYRALPTAAQFVATGVCKRLGWAGYRVQTGRIRRAQPTEGDYGTMNAEQRKYWMARNGLSVDDELFAGRHVVVIDDIRITGSHEHSIHQMFTGTSIQSLTSLYVVELDSELAERDPGIENRMNHASIRTLADLYELMWHEDYYVPTARTVKFVLDQPLEEIARFVRLIDCGTLRAIHQGLLDDGYYRMQTYRDGTATVLHEVSRRVHRARRAARKFEHLSLDQKNWLSWDPAPYGIAPRAIRDWPAIPEYEGEPYSEIRFMGLNIRWSHTNRWRRKTRR